MILQTSVCIRIEEKNKHRRRRKKKREKERTIQSIGRDDDRLHQETMRNGFEKKVKGEFC